MTGEIYESAQFLYILVAACLFSNYPRETRLQYVKRFTRVVREQARGNRSEGTRLNISHRNISNADFCLKKKNKKQTV
ncbi:hypothetical protein G4A30_28630 [Escherichia coli]|nr:hypothetical protein [Escherichia coli]